MENLYKFSDFVYALRYVNQLKFYETACNVFTIQWCNLDQSEHILKDFKANNIQFFVIA